MLNVGAYPTNPPFEYKNESGTFEGFEVDIVNEAAKRIGMTTDIADLGFQALFAATSSKRIDVAISSITITAGAAEIAVVHAALLRFRHGHRDQDRQRDQGPRPTSRARSSACCPARPARTGPRQHQEADGFSEVKGYDTQQNLLLDLSAGRVDAAVSDIPGMEYSFTKMKDLDRRRSASRPANSTA